MGFARNEARNRQIYLAFRSGTKIADLASAHDLCPSSIAAILVAERHKHAISPRPEYRRLRDETGLEAEPGPV